MDGAFLSLRTKLLARAEGMVVSARGVIIEVYDEPIVPTGDIAVTIGDAAPMVIPFSAIRMRGSGRDVAVIYQGSTGIRRFLLANGPGSFAFSTSPLAEQTVMHPEADGATCHAAVPIRLDVSMGDGVRTFTTEVEVIERPSGSRQWVRPARPCSP